MKVFSLKNIAKSGFLASLVLLALSALASSKGSLTLSQATNVGGKQLASGNYIVQWDGTGDQVEVKVYQGKKEVASTSAHVAKIDQRASYDQTITSAGSNGSSVLKEIRFHGKDFALQLSGESSSASSGGAAQ